MELIPAIDLRGGRVVRLLQGDDARRTAYPSTPEEVLAAFVRAGARRVHLVDLDAAFGEAPQRDLVEGMTRRAGEEGAEVQLGGGLRDEAAVAWALGAGCGRVVLGSMVAREPERFAGLAREYAGRVVPALDLLDRPPHPRSPSPDPGASPRGARGGRGTPPPGTRGAKSLETWSVRIAGWTEGAGRPLAELCRELRGLPCPAVLVTDVSRDGTLGGPNLELAGRVAGASGLPALLSGGVGSLEDLARAAATDGLSGAVVGKALHEGRFTVEQALDFLRGDRPGEAPA